jgi:hypothetical protein
VLKQFRRAGIQRRGVCLNVSAPEAQTVNVFWQFRYPRREARVCKIGPGRSPGTYSNDGQGRLRTASMTSR